MQEVCREERGFPRAVPRSPRRREEEQALPCAREPGNPAAGPVAGDDGAQRRADADRAAGPRAGVDGGVRGGGGGAARGNHEAAVTRRAAQHVLRLREPPQVAPVGTVPQSDRREPRAGGQ